MNILYTIQYCVNSARKGYYVERRNYFYFESFKCDSSVADDGEKIPKLI